MFFERPKTGERAVLFHLNLQHEQADDAQLREFEELVLSAGGDPVEFMVAQRSKPVPRYFIGIGKLDELKEIVRLHEAELVIFNHELSPSQERNLEKVLECRVLDRIGLILDIFAQRARSHEGKLQVELAQLSHMSTRLVRGWTHLERQKGGIGLRGPGETQLESDRRMLRERIVAIEKRLKKVNQQRQQSRRSRLRAEVPTISLVGYTNAGKSSLFNQMTTGEVYAADQLFATLDPTLRRLILPEFGPVIFADTVGFVRDLPHQLVDAFKATLEETVEADLLLHIVDASDEDKTRKMSDVDIVLQEIGVKQQPVLEVYNKIDLTDHHKPRIDYAEDGVPLRVWLSAKTGEGCDLLIQAVAQVLGGVPITTWLALPSSAIGKIKGKLYERRVVLQEQYGDDGMCYLKVRLPRSDITRYLSVAGVQEVENPE